jgi:hypothetical protein
LVYISNKFNYSKIPWEWAPVEDVAMRNELPL